MKGSSLEEAAEQAEIQNMCCSPNQSTLNTLNTTSTPTPSPNANYSLPLLDTSTILLPFQQQSQVPNLLSHPQVRTN